MSTTPTAPATWYTDPVQYDQERWRIFGREWCAVGDTEQVGEHGHYIARVVAGFPLVIVNDQGTLRGFHNVCRHRAGPLVDDGGGQCRSFVCRYHGWAYQLDGHLLSARDFGEDVRAENFSLLPVRVDTWRGIVFVSLSNDTAPLAEWLGGLVAHSADFDTSGLVVTHRSEHRIAANWKVYAENYQEGYHIPLVHPGLNKQIVSSHYEVEIEGAVTVHRAPTRDGSVTNGAWLWRFPGLALNFYDRGMSLESYWPEGPTTTLVSYTFFFDASVSPEECEAAVTSSTAVLDEDRIICESVQRNLAAGVYERGILSPRYEAGVALVQSEVRRALGLSN